MSMTDFALNRRPHEFYLGRVIHLSGSALGSGQHEGYYRLARLLPGNRWDYDFLGFDQPQGEPIYIHDGTRQDLRAVPSTVAPPWWHWVAWFVAWRVVCAIFAAAGNDMPGYIALVWLSVTLVPAWQWFYDIDPVRATKVAMGLALLEVALFIHQRRSRVHT